MSHSLALRLSLVLLGYSASDTAAPKGCVDDGGECGRGLRDSCIKRILRHDHIPNPGAACMEDTGEMQKHWSNS